jgi:hypothetical protein
VANVIRVGSCASLAPCPLLQKHALVPGCDVCDDQREVCFYPYIRKSSTSVSLTVNPVSGAAVCVRPDPISPQWGTDAVIVQALLSGSLSHGKERTRFQQILNLRTKDLSPDLKNTLQGMIGPFWQGNFHSKVPVREACAVLLCRFLISTASSRSKLVWSEWIAKVNAPSTG